MPELDRILAHFQKQADACARLGSPFTAAVLEAAMELLAARDPGLGPVLRFAGDPKAGALALRVAGALHRIAQDGRDHRLTELYRRADAVRARRAAQLLSSALRVNGDLLEAYLAQAPQTNEVARSAMLLGGFLTVAHAWRLPVAVLEIGASAGLNLLFDRYRYDFGDWSWGARDARLTIVAGWDGPRPPHASPIVVLRLGCDRFPLDLRDDDARRRLRSYVWADQKDRIERLDRAIATALADPPHIERADAADWLETQLAQPRPGRVTLILHSIVWQYLGAEAQARITEAITQRGARARVEAPLAWLRLEPEPGAARPELRLTLWPGGEKRLLGLGDYHGRRMTWLDQPRA
jgi:hypothetical protein